MEHSVTMTIEDLLENFALFDSWEDRYRYVIDLGRKLPDLPAELRSDAFKVKGCMSQVWLVPEVPEDAPEILRFRADSDAAIVKGLAAILLILYSGRTAKEILDTDVEAIFAQLGLDQHLSPSRRNGFYSMVDGIKATARARSGANV